MKQKKRKKEVPETSRAAYKEVQKEGTVAVHQDKIMEALSKMSNGGNYEEIASSTGLDKHAVGRRISELARAAKIYTAKEKRPTKAGIGAYVYYIVPVGGMPQIAVKPRKKKYPSVHDTPISEVMKEFKQEHENAKYQQSKMF